MTKEEFNILSPEAQSQYIVHATSVQLEELYQNESIDQYQYDLLREIEGTLPEEKRLQRHEESLKLRRQMAAFA